MVIWRYLQSCGQAFARICLCDKHILSGTSLLFLHMYTGEGSLGVWGIILRAHEVGSKCQRWALICYIGIHNNKFFPSTYLQGASCPT
ncbi:hypothetical protein EYC80_000400 [Monilinia laxa]|uniref:Uncharacterized protein n=1 Tax=Monilinia laxa TaxID=61186 RepID=A0A5N6KAK6_MONLA|nr:hypothetical protein EYC80_000400 [Monilinia laxa]